MFPQTRSSNLGSGRLETGLLSLDIASVICTMDAIVLTWLVEFQSRLGKPRVDLILYLLDIPYSIQLGLVL